MRRHRPIQAAFFCSNNSTTVGSEMRNWFLAAIVATIAGMLVGCATIVTGSEQILYFDSKPSGAEVVINGISVGKTPLTIKYKKQKNVSVTVRQPGYRDHNFLVASDFQPWFFGNILIGGLIGSTTDGASGATVRYSPDHYYSTLEPVVSSTDDRALRSHQAVKFVLLNHTQLVAELAVGSGANLDALLVLLGAKDRAAAIATLRALDAEHDEAIPAFAEAAVAKLLS